MEDVIDIQGEYLPFTPTHITFTMALQGLFMRKFILIHHGAVDTIIDDYGKV
jgi:hypothetical protein